MDSIRKRTIKRISIYTICMFVGAGLATGVFLFIGHISLGEGWAAGTQAVGSIAGIFAAAGVAWWQQQTVREAQERREHHDSVARHVRANRVLGRFLQQIDSCIRQATPAAQRGSVASVSHPDVAQELIDIEGDLHLLPGAGGPAQTAMDAYWRAQNLLTKKHLEWVEHDEYVREMGFARKECVTALQSIQAFLEALPKPKQQAHQAAEQSKARP